jgi:hypothetical protein
LVRESRTAVDDEQTLSSLILEFLNPSQQLPLQLLIFAEPRKTKAWLGLKD